ncbi:MAG: hypothetical protein IPM01_30995 [Burkholderiaceae bacterium]|nr:hypothetical protein [Burkholderiaceae bacterium]
MAEDRSRRIFFALWPDGEAAGHLSALAHSLAAGGGRTIQPVSLHLTLAFIGSVTSAQVEELERIASGVRGTAFDLSLDRLGFWPRGGTLWAGCRQAPAAAPPGRSAGHRLACGRFCGRCAVRFGTGGAHHAGAACPLRFLAAPGDAHRLAGGRVFPGRKPPPSVRGELQDARQLSARRSG